MKKKKKLRLSDVFVWSFLILFAVAVIFPVVFTVSASFMSTNEIEQQYGEREKEDGYTGFHILPQVITLESYKELLIETPEYLLKFWTYLGICLLIMLGQIFVSILGGYAFSKFQFPFRDTLFFCIIILMLLPYQVTQVPTYMVIESLGLKNSFASLILPGIFSAFGIFFLRQNMMSISDSILEAAYLEGASSWKVLWSIVVPNCIPGITALGILSFVDSWSMVEQPMVMLSDSFKQPLSVLLLEINEITPALSFACGGLIILPVIFLLLFCEEKLVDGIGNTILK